MHDVDPPRVLQWRSLSGVQNSGSATFEARGDVTTVSLTITYTLPDVGGVSLRPLVENAFAQRFVRRTMLSTMEVFREKLEAEHAKTLEAAGVEGGVAPEGA